MATADGSTTAALARQAIASGRTGKRPEQFGGCPSLRSELIGTLPGVWKDFKRLDTHAQATFFTRDGFTQNNQQPS